MDIVAIKELIDASLDKKIYFDDFAEQAMSFGVRQIVLDLVKREHVFYGDDDAYFVYQLPDDYEFAISEAFDAEAVQAAINNLDTQKISPEDFMHAASRAGVMIAMAFLNEKRCVYLGRTGQFYLEEW